MRAIANFSTNPMEKFHREGSPMPLGGSISSSLNRHQLGDYLTGIFTHAQSMDETSRYVAKTAEK